MTKLIIDTDIGTDVDDALALTYAVRSGLDIALITATHGDAKLRAQIAKKLTRLLGVHIPVAAGEDFPLQIKQKFWSGIEEKNLESGEHYEVQENGVEALAQTIYTHSKNITLISLAPLTTITKAFQQYPDLPEHISQMYLMGNAILCGERYHLNFRAHNFKVDPHAVDVVFATDVPKTIVTTEVCKQNYFTRQDFAALRETHDPALEYIADAADRWLEYSMYDVAYLYDPLVVHHLVDDSCTEKRAFGKDRITVSVRKGYNKEGFKEILLRGISGQGDQGEKKRKI